MPMITPPWLPHLLARFGKNPWDETIYKVVWSEDRRQIEFGKSVKRYGEGKNRWVLEKWLSPDYYGLPELWDEEAQGPFPHHGDYETSHIIEVDGQFVSLDQFGAETLALLMTCIERGKLIPLSEKLRFKREQEEKAKAEWRTRFSDIYDDAQGPFGENAVAGIPGKRRPDDVKLYSASDLPKALRDKIAKRPGEIKQI